jgi:hypothetical protein
MDAKTKREKDLNRLMEDCGVFWAFSNKQFDENKTPLKDGEKYVSIGMGGYMPKGNADTYIDGIKKIDENFKEAMQDKETRLEYIKYELSNHEAGYTGDITDTLLALGEDFTHEEVLSVFKANK